MAAPGYIAPLLPTLVHAPPDGPAWEHEIKFDGYRTMICVDNSSCRAFTRRGFDWSERYAPILKEAKRLKCKSAYLDGEMVVQDEQGRSDFVAFQADLQAGKTSRLVYYAFDWPSVSRRAPLSLSELCKSQGSLPMPCSAVQPTATCHMQAVRL